MAQVLRLLQIGAGSDAIAHIVTVAGARANNLQLAGPARDIAASTLDSTAIPQPNQSTPHN